MIYKYVFFRWHDQCMLTVICCSRTINTLFLKLMESGSSCHPVVSGLSRVRLFLSMVHLARCTYGLRQVGTRQWPPVCCYSLVTTASGQTLHGKAWPSYRQALRLWRNWCRMELGLGLCSNKFTSTQFWCWGWRESQKRWSSDTVQTAGHTQLTASASVFKIKLHIFWILWSKKYLFK